MASAPGRPPNDCLTTNSTRSTRSRNSHKPQGEWITQILENHAKTSAHDVEKYMEEVASTKMKLRKNRIKARAHDEETYGERKAIFKKTIRKLQEEITSMEIATGCFPGDILPNSSITTGPQYENSDEGIRLRRDGLPRKEDDICSTQAISEVEGEKGHASLRQGKVKKPTEHVKAATKTRPLSVAVQKFLRFVELETGNAGGENDYENNEKDIRLKRDELLHKADGICTAKEVSEEEREKRHALPRQDKVQEASNLPGGSEIAQNKNSTANFFGNTGGKWMEKLLDNEESCQEKDLQNNNRSYSFLENFSINKESKDKSSVPRKENTNEKNRSNSSNIPGASESAKSENRNVNFLGKSRKNWMEKLLDKEENYHQKNLQNIDSSFNFLKKFSINKESKDKSLDPLKHNTKKDNSGNFRNLPGASKIAQNKNRSATFLGNLRQIWMEKLLDKEENRHLEHLQNIDRSLYFKKNKESKDKSTDPLKENTKEENSNCPPGVSQISRKRDCGNDNNNQEQKKAEDWGRESTLLCLRYSDRPPFDPPDKCRPRKNETTDILYLLRYVQRPPFLARAIL